MKLLKNGKRLNIDTLRKDAPQWYWECARYGPVSVYVGRRGTRTVYVKPHAVQSGLHADDYETRWYVDEPIYCVFGGFKSFKVEYTAWLVDGAVED